LITIHTNIDAAVTEFTKRYPNADALQYRFMLSEMLTLLRAHLIAKAKLEAFLELHHTKPTIQ
jgi:ribosomal 50S subunit-associated protein YjgA (DUF615 family)